MTTLAIFDIDGTLVRGSTERRFWRYLLVRGRQGPRQILAYLWFLLRFSPTYGVDVAKKNKAYLFNLEVADVQALAAAFVATEIPRLFAPTLERLRQHLRRGDTVVLLSGTLEPIARAFADTLGVERVCATVCSQRNGRYRADRPEVHPFGQAKLELAAEIADELGTELRHASAYADSGHDLPLLRAVGEPVAVLPNASLAIAAADADWEVIASDDARRRRIVPH
jgi:HAD superfamily hydrolase (TIGR01490 family)